MIETIKRLVYQAAETVRETSQFSLDRMPEFSIEQPRGTEHGDFSTNAALVLAKKLKIQPFLAASALVENLQKSENIFNKIEIVKPGFINFFLSDHFIQESLRKMSSKKNVSVEPLSSFSIEGSFDEKQDSLSQHKKKFLLEFVSANPTGPLNVVNARAAAVGDTLARLIEASGHTADREFYVNDEGSQIEHLAYSLQSRYLQLLGSEPPKGYKAHGIFWVPADWSLETAEDLYQGEYLKGMAEQIRNGFEKNDSKDELSIFKNLGTSIYGRKIFSFERIALLKNGFGDKLLELIPNEKERIKFLSCTAVIYNVSLQKEVLKRFRLEFQNWFFQSQLGEKVTQTIDHLKEKGHLYEQDGAVWFKSTAFHDDKDRVLIRQDGSPTYFATDIAYHAYKKERGYDKLIDFLGPDHHGYIARTKAAVQALGYPPDSIELYLIQLVTLLSGGKPVRMSKRAGEFITITELLDDVGVDAARWYFLARHRDTHLDFDLDLAKLQSEENPLYYTQYAYARISSLIRMAEEQGIAIPSRKAVDLTPLQNEAEKSLIKKMAQYPSIIQMASSLREPHHLPRYAVELARTFHSFYTECRILGIPGRKLTDARLFLVFVCKEVLGSVLGLMGIEAVEKM